MLKTSKKRVVVDSHESPFCDEEARFRFKYQNLLQDYLELQKEFVSKKRKLQTAKQKREILLAEVGFLRQRHRYLLKMQSDGLLLPQDIVPQENSSVQKEVVGEPLTEEKKLKNCFVNSKRVCKKKISWQDLVLLNV